MSQLFGENDSRAVFKCLVFRKTSCTFHLSFEDYFCSVKGFKKRQTSAQAHTKKEQNTRLWEEAEILSVLLNDPGIQQQGDSRMLNHLTLTSGNDA